MIKIIEITDRIELEIACAVLLIVSFVLRIIFFPVTIMRFIEDRRRFKELMAPLKNL